MANENSDIPESVEAVSARAEALAEEVADNPELAPLSVQVAELIKVVAGMANLVADHAGRMTHVELEVADARRRE